VPLTCDLNDCDVEEETRSKRNECRRFLLNAGADPTIPMDESSSALAEAVTGGTVVSLLSFRRDSIASNRSLGIVASNPGSGSDLY
jgi:hypothetical protein